MSDIVQEPRNRKFKEVYKSVEASPLILFFVGGLTLLFWAVATVTQIRTSEALALHGGKVPVEVAWSVLLQPIQTPNRDRAARVHNGLVLRLDC